MNTHASVAGLVTLIGTMLVVPLIPTLRELWGKTDAEPLNVIQQHAGDIRHFAQSFAGFIKELAPVMEQCRTSGAMARGVLSDSSEYAILAAMQELPELEPLGDGFLCPYVAVLLEDFVSPPATTFSKEIYARGDFRGGKNNQYRAILSEKSIWLAEGSTVLRWANAEKKFAAAGSNELYGRISAGESIQLERGCTFLRLNAPRIELGAPTARDTECFSDNPPITSRQARRTLYDGDFEVKAGEVVHGDLVTRGALHIRTGARVVGSVKSNRSMILEPEVIIEGSAVSMGDMVIGAESALHGPVIAEHRLTIHSNARFGSDQKPTTVSSLEIKTEKGVVIFGTLWARQAGKVVERL